MIINHTEVPLSRNQKQVHDTQLVTAQEGADHIRQMAVELGVSKMVVK